MREKWSSRLGFVLATAGFAVGLGNIWRFPYLVGEGGGGAFLIVYVAFAILIGIPLLTAEISLGRKCQLTPIAGMRKLSRSRLSPWNWIGWLGITAALMISAYYIMLIGWLMAYLVGTVSGHDYGQQPEQTRASYEAFIAEPLPILGYVVLTIASMVWVVYRGVAQGIERLAKFLMPVLVILLVALAIRGLSYPGASEGLAWYLTPDFSKLTGETVLAALGQAFFSIGIGMAAAFGLGSYLDPKDSNVPGNSTLVVFFDTGIAILAGLVLFPALFAFGIDPDQGPGLLFITMTALFEQMPGGALFGAAFFFLLLIAGFTSQIALFEVLVATFVDSLKWTRIRSVYVGALLLLLLCIPIVLSQGPWSEFRIFGMDLFSFVDHVSGNYLLAFGGLLILAYVLLGWGWEEFCRESNQGAKRVRIGSPWKPVVGLLIPVAVLIVLFSGLGLFD